MLRAMSEHDTDRDYEAAMARARRAALAVSQAQSELNNDLAQLREEIEKAKRARQPATADQP